MALRKNVKLLPHQTQGVGFMLRHNYCLNCDEQGLGKTLQAIAVQQASGLDCLVICPATLKYNWKEEFEKFTDEKSVHVGLKKHKINIVNYEMVYKCTELFMKADIVIIDEAHYLKNMEADRSKYVHRLVSKYKPERLIQLTGTPIKNRVPDFYSLLRLASYSPVKNNGRNILEKYKDQTSYNNRFSKRYEMKVKVNTRRGGSFYKQVVKYSGVKNDQELKAFMRFKLIRRKASKVLGLPKVTPKYVIASYKENKELEKAWLMHEAGEEYNTSAKVEAAELNAHFCADYIKDILGEDDPVIVFSSYKSPLNIIEKKLGKRYKIEKVTGDYSALENQEKVKAFQRGEVDLLLCTYGAGSTGHNMTKSRNMVLNDESWDVTEMDQAVKRFDRIGQTRPCVLHKIIGTSTARKISESNKLKAADIGKIIE